MVRIIDASVAIQWFVEEKGREKALAILGEVLKSPGRFAVPELFYFELTHVFHKLIPNPSTMQKELLTQLTLIGIHRSPMTPDLLSEIGGFQRTGLSGYDAAYVALAKILKGKWVTFDEKAHTLVADSRLTELL